jgi:hypothetical protein
VNKKCLISETRTVLRNSLIAVKKGKCVIVIIILVSLICKLNWQIWVKQHKFSKQCCQILLGFYKTCIQSLYFFSNIKVSALPTIQFLRQKKMNGAKCDISLSELCRTESSNFTLMVTRASDSSSLFSVETWQCHSSSVPHVLNFPNPSCILIFNIWLKDTAVSIISTSCLRLW